MSRTVNKYDLKILLNSRDFSREMKAILKALDDGNGFPKKINVELEIPIKL